MEVKEERLIALAKEYEFTAAILPQEALVVVEEYRKFCEENRCGNFNRNYSCPPYSGTVREMHERMQCFQRALILRSDYTDIDSWDDALTKRLKGQHNVRTRKVLKAMKEEGLLSKVLLMTAGPCSFCKECSMPEGIPCGFEEERASCMSAYAVDVAKMAEAVGWVLCWDRDKTSLFSLVLY